MGVKTKTNDARVTGNATRASGVSVAVRSSTRPGHLSFGQGSQDGVSVEIKSGKQLAQFWGKKRMDIPKSARTRVGNRKEILADVDMRDIRVKRAKELYFGILSDLGGPDYVTTIQDSISKLLAFQIMIAEEHLRNLLEKPAEFDQIIYLAQVAKVASIGKLLGLRRVMVTVNDRQTSIPTNADSLEEYLDLHAEVEVPKPDLKTVNKQYESSKVGSQKTLSSVGQDPVGQVLGVGKKQRASD